MNLSKSVWFWGELGLIGGKYGGKLGWIEVNKSEFGWIGFNWVELGWNGINLGWI